MPVPGPLPLSASRQTVPRGNAWKRCHTPDQVKALVSFQVINYGTGLPIIETFKGGKKENNAFHIKEMSRATL